MTDDGLDRVLDRVDPAKRTLLKALVTATAFAVPTVISFSMDELSMYEAHAQHTSNLMPPSPP